MFECSLGKFSSKNKCRISILRMLGMLELKGLRKSSDFERWSGEYVHLFNKEIEVVRLNNKRVDFYEGGKLFSLTYLQIRTGNNIKSQKKDSYVYV